MDRDCTEELAARVRDASSSKTPQVIVGGDSKCFLGRAIEGERIEVRHHRGILRHDPAELVLTARAGTPLVEIEASLAAQGQRLPFEPPHFGEHASLGGTVACGLAGPARAWSGPLRDYVLGVRLLTGDGRVLRFGGEVMKNVAGYDVARLMVGAFGVLGVLLDVSLKLLPLPQGERTLALELDEAAALGKLAEFARGSMPMTAGAWIAGRLYVRFEGSEATLDEVQRRVGGEALQGSGHLWSSMREQTHEFFDGESPLWRCTLPPLTPPLPVSCAPLIEWNGQQRWYQTAGEDMFGLAAAAGGHAILFRRAPEGSEPFAPLSPPLLRLHKGLKHVFDPARVLNPGRMYAEL
jgi:glycolate dehydrogenase FAD-binding subunit